MTSKLGLMTPKHGRMSQKGVHLTRPEWHNTVGHTDVSDAGVGCRIQGRPGPTCDCARHVIFAGGTRQAVFLGLSY